MTIHGAGFSAVQSVTIGGKKARGIHVRSAITLTVVIPAHAAGSAAIIVKEKAGTSPASAVRFRYLGKPRLTGMSAHSGPVTGGETVTLSGSNFSYVTGVMKARARIPCR